MKKIVVLGMLSLCVFGSEITIHDTKSMLVNSCIDKKNSKKVCECAEELTHRDHNLYGVTLNLNLEKSPDYDGEASDYLSSYDRDVESNIKQCKKSKGKLPKDTRELDEEALNESIHDLLDEEFEKRGIPEMIGINIINCMIEGKDPYSFAKTLKSTLHTTWYYDAIKNGYAYEDKLTKEEMNQLNSFGQVVKYIAEDTQFIKMCTYASMY